ncbi:mesenchyme-specific cell surface glycoprotein-like [Ylistrum balloti]|uniref:mesenchyme-specific cell surface glycoprotein-like n=1 Tax=Ylistrum balloti TaxID=509963 RepID=UPI0029059575|nr:mesenchyme-specific cell surface glycoprotein-like [Ylistrum balloti]
MTMWTLLLLALPTVTAVLKLNNVGYLNLIDCETGSNAMFLGTANQAAFDPTNRFLYVTGSKCVNVVNIANPSQPSLVATHFFNDGNDGRLVDIAQCGNNVAVLFESVFEFTEGHVYMCDVYDLFTNSFNCDKFNRITVGETPKSMTFTNDCSKLLVANEGRPGVLNGIFTDPDGTVSIITASSGSSPSTRELSLSHFNDEQIKYINAGVRWVYQGDHNNGIVTKFSQDLEPEQVAISDDGNWAYVTLPENNAMAVIDLMNEEWHALHSMGVKDWALSSLDASDDDGGASMISYPVKSLNQPTAAVFVQANTNKYVVTANTGVPKTYTDQVQGVNFKDSVRAKSALTEGDIDQGVMSDSLKYDLISDNRLGKVYMSEIDGKSIISGLIETIYLFGGRDIGFWNTETNITQYTTGNDLEAKALESYPSVFNGDCSNDTLTPASESDSRSPWMGPEPNVLAVGEYNNLPFVATATRNGLIYLHSIPFNSPTYQSVHRLGDTTAKWGDSQGTETAGDGLISDMGFIPRNWIGNNPYLFVISRGTGSVSIKEILNE